MMDNTLARDGANAAYRYKMAQQLMGDRNGIPDTKENIQERQRMQIDIMDALEAAVRLNPLNAEYHLRMGWEYTNFRREPDYQQKWMRAADISMERAAYFAGEKNPRLHMQLGHYWVIRSKSIYPAETERNPIWNKARKHYQKAMDLERSGKRKRLLKEIKKHVLWYYPDDDFVKESIEQISRPTDVSAFVV